MSTTNQPRRRSDLAAGLRLPPGQWARLLGHLLRRDVLLRLLLCLVAALTMWAVTQGWSPPFAYRGGYTPARDLVAKVDFSTQDLDGPENERRRQRARAQTVCVYKHDVKPLIDLRDALKNRVFQIAHVESYAKLNADDAQAWQEFVLTADGRMPENAEQVFSDFRSALADDMELMKFENAVQVAMAEYERDGLLVQLSHQLEDGSQTTLSVYPVGRPELAQQVDVAKVRIAQATKNFEDRLRGAFQASGFPEQQLDTLSRLVWNWLQNKRLPVTLQLDSDLTAKAHELAESQIEPALIGYLEGDRLAAAGKPLRERHVRHLREEHTALAASLTWQDRLRHTLADLGMFLAMYVLCGVYCCYYEPRLMREWRRLVSVLLLVVLTVTACHFAQLDPWRSEIIPLTLFGITVAIAYRRELALLLSTVVALISTLSAGQGLGEFVIVLSAMSSSILLVGRIRSRTKLIYVGTGVAAVVGLTTIGVGTLVGQPFGWSGELTGWVENTFLLQLLAGAAWHGFCAVLAGLLMTGLLPFIEQVFDVQTDISLLELGDAAHPLLQELVRRAPGTYNHSINVASIAEAAADAIGANGLLCRVGAYFHDIGKMLKPGYFVENQGSAGSRHDSLMPAMSTLVIIAHVKDGADLARQHRLPRSIIHFIEQHHGTTLVEYFYNQAAKRSESDSTEVDETSFRYPGPKPQTREAAVLMIADASESACRSLPNPAPARIGNLVHDIAMNRLQDGQFDECNLTLRELALIEESVVKSLTAVYHGRVKYPSQQTA